MKTEVQMIRKFNGCEIKQRNTDEYFCANDIVTVGNIWRNKNGKKDFNFSLWLSQSSTKEFISNLEYEIGKPVIEKGGRGRNSQTWVHPFLFIDLALAINPVLKIKVYRWVYDDLIKYRNDSCDSYKKMCGALYITQSNKSNFEDDIKKLAFRIKNEIGVEDWQKATQEQLKLRDKIHENIALLSDILRDREMLYQTAIRKAKEDIIGIK